MFANIIGLLIVIGIVFYLLEKNQKTVGQEPVVYNPFDWDSYYSTKIPPLNLENPLPPPWEKFSYDRYDMGWRMGSGEEYIGLWGNWYGKLEEKDKVEYQQKFPEPESGYWTGYYKDEHPEEND